MTWLLVACFDILFALNNVPHPGRQAAAPNRLSACARAAAGPARPGRRAPALAAAGDARLLPALDRLVDDLEHLLADGL